MAESGASGSSQCIATFDARWSVGTTTDPAAKVAFSTTERQPTRLSPNPVSLTTNSASLARQALANSRRGVLQTVAGPTAVFRSDRPLPLPSKVWLLSSSAVHEP